MISPDYPRYWRANRKDVAKSTTIAAMAIKTVLVDDIDGSNLPAGSKSTTFALDGVSYEIDLGPANAAQLSDALAPYIAAARRTGSPRATSRSTATDPARLAAIREWARANGHTVSDRGRIAGSIVAAYDAGH